MSLIIDFSWIRFFRFRTCHLALLPRRVKSDTWCGPPLRQGLMIASLASVFLPLTCGAPDQMRFLCLCSPRVRWSGVAPPLELNRMCCRHFPETSPTFSSSSPGHSSILISFLTLPPSLPSLAFPHSCSWSVPFPDLLMWSQSGQDTRRRGFKVQVFLFVHFFFFFWVGYFVLWHRLTHITLPPPSSSCRSDTHTHVNLPTSYSYIILVTELLLAKTSFNFFQPGGKSYFLRK